MDHPLLIMMTMMLTMMMGYQPLLVLMMMDYHHPSPDDDDNGPPSPDDDDDDVDDDDGLPAPPGDDDVGPPSPDDDDNVGPPSPDDDDNDGLPSPDNDDDDDDDDGLPPPPNDDDDTEDDDDAVNVDVVVVDVDDDTACTDMSIVEAICAMPDTSRFCDIARDRTEGPFSSGLDPTTNYTVFAPNDQAFAIFGNASYPYTGSIGITDADANRMLEFHFYENLYLTYDELA